MGTGLEITDADGLADNICRKIYVWKSDVWVATPSGLSCIRFDADWNYTITNFDERDGLPSSDVNDLYADSSGIYVAM